MGRTREAMTGLAAVLALAGLSVGALPPKVGASGAGDIGMKQGSARQATEPADAAARMGVAGHDQAEAGTAKAVRQTLARLGNAAVAGKTDDVVAVLSRPARARLSAAGSGRTSTALQAAADKFRAAFQTRYGEAFEVRPEMLADWQVLKTDVPTRVSVVVLAGATPKSEPAASAATEAAAGSAAGGVQVPTKATAAGSAGAQAQAAAEAGVTSGLGASLVKEGDDVGAWRIVVADGLTRAQLEQELAARLGSLSQPGAQWPATAREMEVRATGEMLGALAPGAMAAE